MGCNRYHNAELLKYMPSQTSEVTFFSFFLPSSFVTPGKPAWLRINFRILMVLIFQETNCNSQTVVPLPFKRTQMNQIRSQTENI